MSVPVFHINLSASGLCLIVGRYLEVLLSPVTWLTPILCSQRLSVRDSGPGCHGCHPAGKTGDLFSDPGPGPWLLCAQQFSTAPTGLIDHSRIPVSVSASSVTQHLALPMFSNLTLTASSTYQRLLLYVVLSLSQS